MQRKKEDKICHMCVCVCVWFKKTGKCLVEFWMILYLVSSHIVNIYLFVWWWNQNPMIFSLCNSHLIWMFWGKNLEPFWIIIEHSITKRERERERSHNNTLWCLHHLLVEKWWFAQGDEKTSYHSRIFTIRSKGAD